MTAVVAPAIGLPAPHLASLATVEDYNCSITEPQHVQRGIAAGLASALSSVALNPLDIVKVS